MNLDPNEQNALMKAVRLRTEELRLNRLNKSTLSLPSTPSTPSPSSPVEEEGEPIPQTQDVLELAKWVVNRRRNVKLRKHPCYDKLRLLVALRKNAWLVGPAGSGKTTAAKQIADELNIPFAAPSIGRETTKSEIFGFMHAHGGVVRTMFRECWENGGLILLDEFDYASAAVGTSLNTATSSPFAGFPDSTIERHPDFALIATANTYGTGATSQYIGSNALNAATLNRFVFLKWPYDEAMERAISMNKDWAQHVQRHRKAASDLNINFVISPRATIDGADLLAVGFTVKDVEEMVLFKGLDEATVEKIKANA